MIKKIALISIVICILILPFIFADVLMPTKTNVYFEKNNQSYNEKIDFTVKGYGYNTAYPGSSDYVGERPANYTSTVVYAFSATYNKYGDPINENYYMNHRVIDYFELEGKLADGSRFVIKNISNIPSNCTFLNLSEDADYKACIAKLVVPNVANASNQSVGTIREDYLGRNWTKGGDGMWTTPSEAGLSWADVMWAETDKSTYSYNEGKSACENALNSRLSSGSAFERACELRFNLDAAQGVENIKPQPAPIGFFKSVGCFFKRLFGGSC